MLIRVRNSETFLPAYLVMNIYLTDVLLAQEVSDLDEGAALRDGAVDGEVSIHGPHLVTESLNQKNV